jgi:hypothetical protein
MMLPAMSTFTLPCITLHVGHDDADLIVNPASSR